MSFDWTHYLSLAQELAGRNLPLSPGQEAKDRAAISRAYYAAFCRSRNHLRDFDGAVFSKGAKVHAEVKREFANSPDNMRRSIARNLDRLRKKRNEADYDDKMPNLSKDTVFYIKLAERVVSDLGKL